MLNAGMCHLDGLGTATDVLQAFALFTRGAHTGSFRCIMEAANILSAGAPGIKRYGWRAVALEREQPHRL